MSDERRRPFETARPKRADPAADLPAPARDPRRATGRQFDRAPDVVTPRAALERPPERPAVMVSERELEAFRWKLKEELDQRVADLAAGLEERVKHAVKSELVPYIAQLSKIDDVLEQLATDRLDRERYRARQEERAAIESEKREREAHDASIAKARAETGAITANTQLVPVEASRKYKLALLGVIVSVLTVLAGLIGAAVGSQRRGP